MMNTEHVATLPSKTTVIVTAAGEAHAYRYADFTEAEAQATEWVRQARRFVKPLGTVEVAFNGVLVMVSRGTTESVAADRFNHGCYTGPWNG